MPRANKEPFRCKATAKSSGKRCQLRAGDDGYCWKHPRDPGGAPVGNRNGQIHGIYTKGITPEEEDLARELDLLSIDGELLTHKLQYLRIWRVVLLRSGEELPVEQQINFDNLIRLYESRVTEGGGSETTDSSSTTCRMPDFDMLLDRSASRIESLTKMKMNIEERDELLEQIAELRDKLAEITKAGNE